MTAEVLSEAVPLDYVRKLAGSPLAPETGLTEDHVQFLELQHGEFTQLEKVTPDAIAMCEAR